MTLDLKFRKRALESVGTALYTQFLLFVDRSIGVDTFTPDYLESEYKFFIAQLLKLPVKDDKAVNWINKTDENTKTWIFNKFCFIRLYVDSIKRNLKHNIEREKYYQELLLKLQSDLSKEDLEIFKIYQERRPKRLARIRKTTAGLRKTGIILGRWLDSLPYS